MSQRTETICDQCGAHKGETNHWWFVWSDDREFNIIAYESGHIPTKNDKDYCSENCVTRALGEFFDSINAKRKLEADIQTLEDVAKDFDQSLKEAGY